MHTSRISEGLSVFSPVACKLGEGPIWSPEVSALIWSDIEQKRILMQKPDGETVVFQMDIPVSALARFDEKRMLASTAHGIGVWAIGSTAITPLVSVEEHNTVTRSNDGRTDTKGAFWVSTMGHKAEPQAGSLYRFTKGKLNTIARSITIPNSLCFSPNGEFAYFSDTVTGQIIRWSLDAKTGEPTGEAEIFVDISETGFGPDGSVVDAEGYLWNAQWGGSRVVRYAPNGTTDRTIELPTSQPTCPAFGGPDGKTLFITTAYSGMSDEQRAAEPLAGATFCIPTEIDGFFDPLYDGEIRAGELLET